MVESKVDSFFNIFKSLKRDDKEPEEKPEKKDKGDDDDEDDGGEDDIDTQMMDAVELGDQIKDDLVPLALEYYLGVIELEDPEDEEGEGDDDFSDDDEGPKISKPKKGGKGKKNDGAAPNQKDCKQ